MAFGGFNKGGESTPMAEINMIPLIDVMLVLLVIFIITAPLMTHAVKINLPTASSTPNETKPDHIDLSVDGNGTTYWNGDIVTREQMLADMDDAAKKDPQPELHLRADKTTQYQVISEVMSAAAKAGIQKIGFVSEPSK